MWGVDDTSAETIAMNPWNPGPQAQGWQGIPRGAQNGPGAFPPSGVQVGGPPTMRGQPRWDPAAAQAPGWQTPQNPPGGWGTGPPASSQPNGGWAPLPQQQQQTQWGGGQASHSYADTAKKNMPPSAMPVRGGGQPPRMDSSSGWGSGVKVDQLTPWDTAANAAAGGPGPGPAIAHLGGHEPKSNEWGGGGGGGGSSRDGTGRWSQPQQQQQAAARPNYDNNDMNWHGGPAAAASGGNGGGAGGTAHWGAGAHGGPAPAGSTGTWGGSGGGSASGHHHDQHPARLQYDPNPQTPGPWVPPQPTEMNNDMMWHDPNPKQKKVQRDTGTAVWGDPGSQVTNDIRRWKDTDTDDVVLPPGASGSSVWDSTPASQLPTVGWGEPSPSAASANNGVDQWSNPAAPVSASGWDSSAAKSANASSMDDATTASSGSDDAFGNASNGNSAAAQKTLNGTTSMQTSVMQTLAEQMKRGGAGNADGGNLASLTQQIADQLRVAVSKGLININILNQPLPQQTLVLLNQLLQRVPKLEQANIELAQLRQRTVNQTMNAAQQAEYDRLMHEIQSLQAEISGLQTKINDNAGIAVNGSVAGAAGQNGARLSAGADSQQSGSAATTPMDGGSKLLQWKNGDSNDKLAGSASDSNLPNLVSGVQSMNINGGDKDAWLSGKLDWSPPGSADLGTSVDTMKSDDGMPAMIDKSNSLPNPSSTHQSGSATPTPPVDEGPQEFVPGKKWEWRDPKAVADDPNATPGNCKQNPLLSSSGGNSLGSGFMNFGGGGGSNNPLGGNVTPTKMNDPRFGMGGGWNGAPGGFGANTGDPWTRSRPPSNLGAPYPGALRPGGPGAPFNRSMSSPGQSAFQPYGAWILVHTSNQNEQQLRAICGKIGQVASFIMPPGSNMACIKYADMIPDQAFIRLKTELGPVGVQMQVVPDNDVERIMKGIGGRQPPMMPPQPPMWQASEPGWGGPPSSAAFPGMMHDPLGMSAGMPPPALHDQFMPPPGAFPHDDRPF